MNLNINATLDDDIDGDPASRSADGLTSDLIIGLVDATERGQLVEVDDQGGVQVHVQVDVDVKVNAISSAA